MPEQFVGGSTVQAYIIYIILYLFQMKYKQNPPYVRKSNLKQV
jgi:hypothetical protein